MENIKIIKAVVGEELEVVEIPNTLDAMREIVGGWIETVRVAEDILLVVDEEGLLKENETNFMFASIKGNSVVQGSDIVGNCFFVSFEGEDFTSLNEEQIQKILHMFRVDRTCCLMQ